MIYCTIPAWFEQLKHTTVSNDHPRTSLRGFQFLSCFCRCEKVKVLLEDNLILKFIYIADVSIGCSNPSQSYLTLRRIGASNRNVGKISLKIKFSTRRTFIFSTVPFKPFSLTLHHHPSPQMPPLQDGRGRCHNTTHETVETHTALDSCCYQPPVP